MQKVHYDLPPIEAAIRKMYETADPSVIHDKPAVVAAFRKAAPVEIEMTRFFLNEVMAGTEPDITIEAMVTIFANLIMNRLRAFDCDGMDMEGFAKHFLNDIVGIVLSNIHGDDVHRRDSGGVSVIPVPSGNA